MLLGKIKGLALINLDETLFCFKCFAKVYLQNRDGLASFCSDHSPIFFALDMIKEGQRGKGIWKFNSSLLSNKKHNIKNQTATASTFLTEENIFDDQTRWEYLKYEIRKFPIYFSVSETKSRSKEMNTLENKMKTFE